jgi:large subunit ribosomal protein L21
MVSIVEQSGFQYKVAEGDEVEIPLFNGEPGQEITLDRVLLVGEGSDVKVGTPVVEGAEVKAEILEHGKSKKVLVIKKHRRKDYKRKNGHRQDFTKIKITSINS